MEPDDWESDGEFEATILEMDNKDAVLTATSSEVMDTARKDELLHPPSCSTPRVNHHDPTLPSAS